MTAKERKKAAANFVAKWAGKGYEKGKCRKFWCGLLHDAAESEIVAKLFKMHAELTEKEGMK